MRAVRFPSQSGRLVSWLPLRSSVVRAVRFPSQSGRLVSWLPLRSSW